MVNIYIYCDKMQGFFVLQLKTKFNKFECQLMCKVLMKMLFWKTMNYDHENILVHSWTVLNFDCLWCLLYLMYMMYIIFSSLLYIIINQSIMYTV